METPLCDEYGSRTADAPVTDCVACATMTEFASYKYGDVRTSPGVRSVVFQKEIGRYSKVRALAIITRTVPVRTVDEKCACGISNANEISYIQYIN